MRNAENVWCLSIVIPIPQMQYENNGEALYTVKTFFQICGSQEVVVQLALHLIILCQQVLIAGHTAGQNTR